jgi:hypothetical protein
VKRIESVVRGQKKSPRRISPALTHTIAKEKGTRLISQGKADQGLSGAWYFRKMCYSIKPASTRRKFHVEKHEINTNPFPQGQVQFFNGEEILKSNGNDL